MKRTQEECKRLLAAHRAEHYDAPRRAMECAFIREQHVNAPNRMMAMIQYLGKIGELIS